MANENFWNDAARYGAWLGIVEIAFTALSTFSSTWIVSLLHLAAIIALLTVFTRRRVALYGSGEEGYSYGKCLKYIFFMSVFAGVLLGAYSIVAANFLFPEKYRAIVEQTISALAQTGIYADTMLEQMKGIYDKMFFSPVYVVLTNVFGMAVKGGFYGLFISAFTKRDENVFGGEE